MPEKGILECIGLAEECGISFKNVGEDKFVSNLSYVIEVMRRCGQSSYAEYVGSVDQTGKVELIQGSRGLVLLPQYPYKEVFGLAAVEAMATGMPILATDNNGFGEVIRTVQNRGTYRDFDMLAADLKRVADGTDSFPSSRKLREGVENHFSQEAMADLYLKRGREAIEHGW